MTTPKLIKKANNYKGEWFWKSLPGYLHFIFGLAEGIVPLVYKRFGYGFEFAVCYVKNNKNSTLKTKK